MRPLPVVYFLFLLFCSSLLNAQSSYQKFGASLKQLISANTTNHPLIEFRNGEPYLPVFLELSGEANARTTAASRIEIRTLAGQIATADIPLREINEIAEIPWIKRIELPLILQKTDTLLKKIVTVDKVLGGTAPLDRRYQGDSILIGIIDDGLDISHPDFLDDNGSTRVTGYWSMDYLGQPPAGYRYGHEWSKDSINDYIAKFNNRNISIYQMQRRFGFSGHGTPVAGLAAGKNGMAPRASLVVVSLTAFGDTILRSDRLVDAISYIYTKAKEQNKKCVVNISLGLQNGAPHDGKTMVEKAIDNFCQERSDLLVAVSAGNNGNSWKHWGGKPIHKDSTFGFFRCAYGGSLYFAIPKRYSDSLTVSIGESRLGSLGTPNVHRDSVFFQTPYLRISDLIQQRAPVSFTSMLNGLSSSNIEFTAAHANEDYDELIISVNDFRSGNTSYLEHLYRFIFKGSGTVHAWYPFLNLHPAFVFNNNPFPNDPTFVPNDNEFTTNIPSHAYSVISSGAFNIRQCYVSTLHNEVVRAYTPCQLTYFTSHGPTLDGRIKPDILSPGENVIAARSRLEDFMGHQFIIDNNLRAFDGTSAASPITAGIAALLWDRFPHYTRDSIILRIKSTAYADAHTAVTGPLPNNISGWGKIDAFKALTGQSTDRQNFCIPDTVCTAPPPPPYVPPVPPTTIEPYLLLYPNPAINTAFLRYYTPVPLTLNMYSSSGQLIETRKLLPGTWPGTTLFRLAHLPAGIYFLKASGENISLSCKLVVEGR